MEKNDKEKVIPSKPDKNGWFRCQVCNQMVGNDNYCKNCGQRLKDGSWKKFEAFFKKNWIDTVPESFIYRLNDQMSGYMGSSNISDFICYKKPELFLIECKAHAGNTFPFSAFRQYEDLSH